MTKPRTQTVKEEAIDRYLVDPDLTIAEAAAEVNVTERTFARWLAERREREARMVGATAG